MTRDDVWFVTAFVSWVVHVFVRSRDRVAWMTRPARLKEPR